MRCSFVPVRLGVIAVACVAVSCTQPLVQTPDARRSPSPSMVQLWANPTDLDQRDLLWGAGRSGNAPSTRTMYTVLKKDDTGFSRGYDVADPDGRKWRIKVGEEAQPEVVLSRILWALGYYQPETYYVTKWQLAGQWELEGQPARFRFESDHKSDGEWDWRDNPFAGSTPLHGLIVINYLLNNWDLKKTQNRIYVLHDTKAEPMRRYVVQDLGASLGKPRTLPLPIGSRNDVDGFERVDLVKKIDGPEVTLDYRGQHRELLRDISIADVVWACELMNRLSDAQLDDAFEAGGYPPNIRERYIRKIRAKLQEGLDLRPLVEQAKVHR